MDLVILDISAAQPYITLAKDVVMALVAIYAARVAHKGLTTWNRQLKGGNEYDLARRILKCTYIWRDAIAGVRSPFISPQEQMAPPPEKANQMTRMELTQYGVSTAYQKRWDRVVEARVTLRTELLEAEAILGDPFVKCFTPLYDSEHKLYLAVKAFLRSANPAELPHAREAYQGVAQANDEILYKSFSKDIPDKFGREIEYEIKKIEILLKPHLGYAHLGVSEDRKQGKFEKWARSLRS